MFAGRPPKPARRGRGAAATAARRGVPLFSEGLSLLVAEAAGLEHNAQLPAALAARLAELVEPIQDLAATAAFGSLATGLRLGPDWADLLPEHGWSAVPALSIPAAPA